MDSADRRQWIVMLGTSPDTLGGVAAAIRSYQRAGLFVRWPIIHLATHSDGTWGRKFARAAASLFRFVYLLLRRRVGLVHVHSASDASFWRKSLFMVLAFWARRPVIFQLHGGGFSDFVKYRCGPVRRRLVRAILDRAVQIVVLSEVWIARVAAITTNPNVCAIPNPVEPEALLAIDLQHRPKQTILLMGRLEPVKGIYDLIDALAIVRARHPAVRLLLAGQGDVDRIRSHAAERDVLDAVEFTGWVSGGAKIDVWRRTGIYALPSYIENLPMSILEAMAAGLPIVASRVGGIPDAVVHEKTGLLIEPRDVTALVSALDRLLSDPRFADRLAVAARERFGARYAPDIILPQLEAIYARLGARPRTGGPWASDYGTIVGSAASNPPARHQRVSTG